MISKKLRQALSIVKIPLLFANLSSLGLSVANFKLLAHFLPMDRFAAYSLLITFQGFSMMFLTSPIKVGLIRMYASSLTKKREADYLLFSTLIMATAGLFSLLIGIILAKLLGGNLDLSGVVFALLFGAGLDYGDLLAGAALQRGENSLAAVRMITGKLALTLGILCSVMLAHTTDLSLIIGSTLGFHILFVLLLRANDRFSVGGVRSLQGDWKNWLKELTGFCWIFIVTGAISWAQVSMPRFFLSWWQSPETIAAYFVVSQISLLPMLALTATVSQIISPRLFRRHDLNPEKVPSPWQKELIVGASLMLGIAFCGAIFSIFFGNWILSLLAKRAYTYLSPLLAIMFVSYGFYSTAQVLRLYGDQIKRPKIYFSINFAYPLLSVILTLLAARFNLNAICLAVLAAETIHVSAIIARNHAFFRRENLNERQAGFDCHSNLQSC